MDREYLVDWLDGDHSQDLYENPMRTLAKSAAQAKMIRVLQATDADWYDGDVAKALPRFKVRLAPWEKAKAKAMKQ